MLNEGENTRKWMGWKKIRVKIVSCPGKGVILHGDITDRRRKDCKKLGSIEIIYWKR